MSGRTASVVEKSELWSSLTALFPKWQMMEDRSERSFKVVILEQYRVKGAITSQPQTAGNPPTMVR
jgi:hypothetical protein